MKRKSLDAIISESIKRTLNERQEGDPITKWVYWCFNYYPNFIEECWADDPNLAQHLKSKFMGYYNDFGSRAVMNKFFVELSSDNQQKLIDYVLSNY